MAGPVAETEPHVPTHLELHFDAGLLTGIEAWTPAGGRYWFTVVAAP
jgi:hypothetical protein